MRNNIKHLRQSYFSLERQNRVLRQKIEALQREYRKCLVISIAFSAFVVMMSLLEVFGVWK